jgi:Tetracyclin repressor-like, C-terminal domain
LRTAATSEVVAGQLQALLSQQITEPIAALGDEQAAKRGAFIAAQLLGMALCRYILRLDPLASLPADEVVAAVAPSVQRHLSRASAPVAAASPPAAAFPGRSAVRRPAG